MVEILVATLVLSFGALGIALMQSRTLSNNNSSMGRSMAVMMSYSILEAMRTDRITAEAGTYNTTVTASSCPTATTTLSDRQLLNWCTQLGQALGALSTTQGTINCNSSGYCTITVLFDDSRIGNTGLSGAGASAGGTTTQNLVVQALL